MKNCLAYADVERVVARYIIECCPGHVYTIKFPSLKVWYDWLHSKCNENKRVVSLHLEYNYKRYDEGFL